MDLKTKSKHNVTLWQCRKSCYGTVPLNSYKLHQNTCICIKESLYFYPTPWELNPFYEWLLLTSRVSSLWYKNTIKHLTWSVKRIYILWTISKKLKKLSSNYQILLCVSCNLLHLEYNKEHASSSDFLIFVSDSLIWNIMKTFTYCVTKHKSLKNVDLFVFCKKMRLNYNRGYQLIGFTSNILNLKWITDTNK